MERQAAHRRPRPAASECRICRRSTASSTCRQGTQAVFPSAVLLSVFNLLGVVEDVLAIVLGDRGPRGAALPVRLDVRRDVERRREIATMRALGARRATMLGHRLVESAALARRRRRGGHPRRPRGRRTSARSCSLRGAASSRIHSPWRFCSPLSSSAVVMLGAAGRAASRRPRVSHGGRREPCAALVERRRVAASARGLAAPLAALSSPRWAAARTSRA